MVSWAHPSYHLKQHTVTSTIFGRHTVVTNNRRMERHDNPCHVTCTNKSLCWLNIGVTSLNSFSGFSSCKIGTNVLGYNRKPQIHPDNFPPSTKQPPSHPSLDQPHSPSQMAPGSIQPFCHSTFSGQTDRLTGTHTHTHTHRPTDGLGDRSVT